MISRQKVRKLLKRVEALISENQSDDEYIIKLGSGITRNGMPINFLPAKALRGPFRVIGRSGKTVEEEENIE